jgi:hypothetical protein
MVYMLSLPARYEGGGGDAVADHHLPGLGYGGLYACVYKFLCFYL